MLGTWFQAVATTWLVLNLSHSATAVGITLACQFAPLFILGPYAGAVSDRWPRYRIMIITQSAAAVIALIFGIFAVLHASSVAEIWGLSVAFGLVDAFDSPARQGLISDLTTGDQLTNGIALSDLTLTISRLAGPPIAGLIILWVGVPACFLINAASYAIVVVTLFTIQARTNHAEKSDIGSDPVRAGLRYAVANPHLRSVLVLVFITGIFGFNFQVLYSTLATQMTPGVVWFGAYNGVLGFGAIIGALAIARLREPSTAMPLISAAVMGASLFVLSFTHLQAVVLSSTLLTGISSATLLSASGGILQARTSEAMRGRIMSLFYIGFLGTGLIGGPLIGYLIQRAGVDTGFGVAGGGCLFGVLGSLMLLTVQPTSDPHA